MDFGGGAHLQGQGAWKAAMAANGATRMDGVRGSRKFYLKLLALGAIAAALASSHAIDRAGAADRKSDGTFITDITDVRRVTVILNKSRTFRLERPFATI